MTKRSRNWRTVKGKDARGKKAAKRARKRDVGEKMMGGARAVVVARVVKVYETANADGESKSLATAQNLC